jgi:beta-lactamase superfamily II metal-dependent hydrolase
MRIDVLDVGKTKYGDCLLVSHAGKRILIDGAHPGDFNRIRSQLKIIFGHDPPLAIDLLVVTHCHQDHIGCLPRLVSEGVIEPAKALVADERLGFGRTLTGGGDDADAGLTPAQRKLLAAFHEEDMSRFSDEELEEFFADETLEEKYGKMLESLKDANVPFVRYGTSPQSEVDAIEMEFAELGLQVLGPSEEHLLECWEVIRDASDALADAIVAQAPAATDAGPASLVAAFRQLERFAADDPAFAIVAGGIGPAKNNQSIVLKVVGDGWTSLLTGDMQFANAQLTSVAPLMTQLRTAVNAAGPYQFVKLSHHTAFNGLNASVLDDYLIDGAPKLLLAHTGGWNDASHPSSTSLNALKAKKTKLTFARTDRNGLITVEKNSQGKLWFFVEKGQINDFSLNTEVDEPMPPGEPEPLPLATTTPQVSAEPGPHIVVSNDIVEVTTRIPHTRTRVTITVDVEPDVAALEKKKLSRPSESRPQAGDPAVGGGRSLPSLLFVTSRTRLAVNIGQREADVVVQAIEASGATLLDVAGGVATAEEAAPLVQAQAAASAAEGIVLVGGFDVVPAERCNAINDAARSAVEAAGYAGYDDDNFIVWSDDVYARRDPRGAPELPVSRIPDGRSASLVFAALGAPAVQRAPRFGVRNLARPFAVGVYQLVAGDGPLEISEIFGPDAVVPDSPRGAVYLMLHGSSRDATRFWGETEGGDLVEGFAVQNVPPATPGSVVCTGCCWGALAVTPPAARLRENTPLAPRGPEGSIALAYLLAGANAFVGCTGSHYSPTVRPYDYFGGPMQAAFWRHIAQGRGAAAALCAAKREFADRIPHGMTDPFAVAVEQKILRQFTCLGLGW